MNRFIKYIITLILTLNLSLIAMGKDESIKPNHEVIKGTFHTAQAPLPLENPKSATEFPDSIRIINKAPNWFKRYLNSLMKGNVDRTFEKKVDLGFGVVPSYTRETGFGLAGAVTGLYRLNRKDSTMLPSDFYASLNASYYKSFVLTIKGNNLFSDHRSRLSYNSEIYQKRLNFWGITSEETSKNKVSQYDRQQIDFNLEYVYKIKQHFYMGVVLKSNYSGAKNIQNPEYLLGERTNYYVSGLGLSFEYDSRNNLVTPTQGIHIAYKPIIYPQFLGNAPITFASHRFIANGYFPLWKGAILGTDLYANINNDNTPWTMREMLASDGIRMRGYYMGSTIDNSQVATQLEYRQHIWRRFGFVAWGGGATLFSDFDEFIDRDIKPKWLYNFGVGLRFEFKHNVNIRIDYGFGENTSGFVFAVGEAF